MIFVPLLLRPSWSVQVRAVRTETSCAQSGFLHPPQTDWQAISTNDPWAYQPVHLIKSQDGSSSTVPSHVIGLRNRSNWVFLLKMHPFFMCWKVRNIQASIPDTCSIFPHIRYSTNLRRLIHHNTLKKLIWIMLQYLQQVFTEHLCSLSPKGGKQTLSDN